MALFPRALPIFSPMLPSRKENPPLCWMLVWQRFTANKDTVVTKMIPAAMMRMQVCVVFFKEEAGKVTLTLNLMFRIVIFVVIFICLSFPQEKNDT